MEKINTEILISSLLAVGFDKVDSFLFTYILSKLSIDNRTMQSFEFIDEEFSNTFKEYVSYDGNTYMIKDMYTIDTLIMTKNGNVPLRKLLHTNKKLITYLDLLDFREIIMKKISLLGAKQLDTIPNYFSNKEKEIMYKMFGIEAMHHEKAIERAIAYENIYEEEAHSMDTLDIDGFLKDIIIRDEEVTKISSSEDYINWLKIFTKKYPGFCFDDWTHDRKELTDIWKDGGINESKEYAILTNEIYKEWSGMKANEYKEFKGLRKESLRDNMTRIEELLTDLGEEATKELAKKHRPQGLEANKKIAKLGGHAAKSARDDLEKNLGEPVITSENNLNYKYIEETKKIDNK